MKISILLVSLSGVFQIKSSYHMLLKFAN